MHVRSPRVRVLLLYISAVVLLPLRALAQQPQSIGFAERPSSDLAVRTFRDDEVDDLLRTLARVIGSPAPSDAPGLAPDLQAWKFTRWLQTARLTAEQETRVVAVLDALAAEYPSQAELLGNATKAVRELTLGKVAPDIVGKSLAGEEFRLSDYRGKVVVVVFSGEWCGICRSEYPYQRFLASLYKDRPFAILSVNSDRDAASAKKAEADRAVPYPSWWDGYADVNTAGPIAKSYAIYGWPTVYVLDETGVIRFVDLRQEDLLKGVRQLMGELALKSINASK